MLDKKQFYINGKWVDPSTPDDFEVINPSNESVCAIISLGSSADTDLAIESANKALPSWSKIEPPALHVLKSACSQNLFRIFSDLCMLLSIQQKFSNML